MQPHLPVAHRARRRRSSRFYARWRLDQLYSAAARRAPGWFAENRRTLISPPGEQSVNQVLPLPDGVQVRIQPLDNRFTFRPVMNIFRHRAFHTDGFSQPFAVNVAFVNPLTTLPQNAQNLPKRLSRSPDHTFCTSPQVRSPIASSFAAETLPTPGIFANGKVCRNAGTSAGVITNW